MLERLLVFFCEILRVLFTIFRSPADMILHVSYWIICGKAKSLPLIDNKILLMSATELAQKIRKREVRAVEVMDAYVRRIKQVQPIVNAYVDERFEEALADARKVDNMLEAGVKTERELAETKPLLGVPFSCKEIIGVKGLVSTAGLKRFKDRKALRDSDAAAQYKSAGAIPVVVTNIPTMAAWCDTENAVFGATKNPYDTNRSAGGSSGGEAALIASAGSIIGIGNDLAGSIRLPSSFCGIYGHKPSQGIISNLANFPEISENSSNVLEKFEPFMSTGPMCRYAEDLSLLLKVMCGEEDCKKLRLDEKVDFSKVTVYYMEQLSGFLFSSTPDVKASVKKAVDYFKETHNTTATKLEIEELKHGFYIWKSKAFELGVQYRFAMPEIVGLFRELWEFVRCVLGISELNIRLLYHGAAEFTEKTEYYGKCLDMYKTIEEKFEVLGENAILIAPVHPEPAPHPIVTIPKFMNVAYTCIFNSLGLPVTAVPVEQSKKGLPIGLQIIAKKNNDHLTLAAAVELSKAFGGWKDPSSAGINIAVP